MDSEKGQPSSHSRLTVLGLCLTFVLAVLVAQFVRYQLVMYPELSERALEQREEEKVELPRRGYIADANGHLLATNIFQWEISATPNQIVDPETLAPQVAALLGKDSKVMADRLDAPKPWVLLERSASQEVGEALAELEAAGLTCEPRPLRTYPMGDLVAHAVGFVNSTGNGFYGVEGRYNGPLKGITGTIRIEKDPLDEIIPLPPKILRRAKPATNLVLTLDLNIQYIAQQELERALARFKAESGTVIVMDPKTGALLAIISSPGYDPNSYADTDPNLLADPSVSSMWEPGSIFKIITWGAALDLGVITPDMTVYDEGEVEVGGRVIENSDRRAHGEVTMTEALARSLNTIAAYISTTLGKDRFYTYVRRFGFGALTNVDLDSEGPGMIKLPGDANWFPSELGTNSFGQGIAVTPMQMVTAVAAVANQGRLMKPYIVQQFITEDERGREREMVQVEPKLVRQAISKEAAETLTGMLVEVVEQRATEARIPGYRIAGKTGTAEIPTAFGYHATDTIVSFVGYAPADDPQFIILVKLDKPRTSRWAAHTAAPAFRAIAERLLVYLQIPPDEIRLAQH